MHTDPRCSVSDETLLQLYETVGPRETARRLKRTVRSVQYRRATIEKKLNRTIHSPSLQDKRPRVSHPWRLQLDIDDGVVLIGSDAHIWPGPLSTAMRAFIKFAGELKPKALILNGDVLDFPAISRHARIGWEERPTVADEIAAANVALKQIEQAVSRTCILGWGLGNHDSRFETTVAVRAPELVKVRGVHLKDHFSARWRPCWSVFINNDVVIKHRFKAGIHAPHNNTMWAGRTIITGHLHSQKIYPLTDYNGTRWGIDTGCLAEPIGRQFVDYMEDNPASWRSGFVVLTFRGGELLPPELVTVWNNDHVVFRGQLIKVPHETQARPARAPKLGRRRRVRR